MAKRLRWAPIIERGAEIVREYDTQVTLRQLFYRLISEGLIPNKDSTYKNLSSLTAKARRDGTFPTLSDGTRTIQVSASWESSATWLRQQAKDPQFWLDRTRGQEVVPFLIVEKATMVAQLWSWFGGTMGIPIAALRGYQSESLERQIRAYVRRDGRKFRAIVAGDFDPTGEDIDRNAQRYLGGSFVTWTRVAVRPAQIRTLGLIENPGKESDSRAREFHARHGRLVQVEIEAIAPDRLRRLFQVAIDRTWDSSSFDGVKADEREQRDWLKDHLSELADEAE